MLQAVHEAAEKLLRCVQVPWVQTTLNYLQEVEDEYRRTSISGTKISTDNLPA
jgi:hypothetical protein